MIGFGSLVSFSSLQIQRKNVTHNYVIPMGKTSQLVSY